MHQGLNRTELVEFHEVDTHSTPPIGLQSCIEFDLEKEVHSKSALAERLVQLDGTCREKIREIEDLSGSK